MIFVTGIIWLQQIVEKIESKHQVTPDQVEEVFKNKQNSGSLRMEG